MLGTLKIAAEVIEKGTELVLNAEEVAELGAVKPEGFGNIMKKLHPDAFLHEGIKEVTVAELGRYGDGSELFGYFVKPETPYTELKYNEVARECSENLADYGITPHTWQVADYDEKVGMLEQATKIMAEELSLPDEWTEKIRPEVVSGELGEATEAQAVARILPHSDGSLEIVDVPSVLVNSKCFESDYYNVMTALYHEMIHVKQYSAIDGVSPYSVTNSALLDLIDAAKKNMTDGVVKTSESYVEYLSSPYEAAAWAQDAYFTRMLRAVMNERFGGIYNL